MATVIPFRKTADRSRLDADRTDAQARPLQEGLEKVRRSLQRIDELLDELRRLSQPPAPSRPVMIVAPCGPEEQRDPAPEARPATTAGDGT